MSEPANLKGRWRFNAGVVFNAAGQPIAYVATGGDFEAAVAIGKAIAALPDLLEATRVAAALEATAPGLVNTMHAVASARAALRLATGG